MACKLRKEDGKGMTIPIQGQGWHVDTPAVLKGALEACASAGCATAVVTGS